MYRILRIELWHVWRIGVSADPVGQGLDLHRVGEAGVIQRNCAVPSVQGLQCQQGTVPYQCLVFYGIGRCCSTTGKPTRSFATERVSLDSV
jgi:hypothetical protein